MKELHFNTLDTKYVYTRNSLVGRLFWKRLTETIDFIYENDIKGDVLEIGCGSGLILPTLSKLFDKVVGIDLNIRDSTKVSESLGLDNVKLICGDILKYYSKSKFDLVIANDVLEHILDIDEVVFHIKNLLKINAYVIISAPTENMLYKISRLILNIKKPADHYHASDDMIGKISKVFEIKEITYIPVTRLKSFSYFAVVLAKNCFSSLSSQSYLK